jgi:predicted dehydrogenase
MMKPIASETSVDRRTFVKAVSAAGLSVAANGVSAQVKTPGRKRYALVGTGGRSGMYRNAILRDYKEHAELVGLCDKNPGRVALAVQHAATNGATVPGYAHTDFDKMIRETRPDTVIVTTVDGFHHEYIVRAMDLGCNAITEKPMTTTAEKCQQILDAKKRTGKNVRVTFNYRYSPPRTQVKDLLMSGEIGDVQSVDFHWLLDTSHGADYFRRWHSNKVSSGGLMVHKATHHFDLVNWWLGSNPVSVFATGKREFYTPSMAKRLGLQSHHERCLTCPEKDKCTFVMDLKLGNNKALYLDQEHHDGYFRDRCVFRPDIDIEDNMNVIVQYDTGANLTYSLNAFNAWEGYMVAFNGTKGRLEHSIVERGAIFGGSEVPGAAVRGGTSTRIIPMRGVAKVIEPWTGGEGGHGGGDTVMLNQIFMPNPETDKYLRASDERGGAASILVGIAANKCFETKQPVQIASLVPSLARPDYAPMPKSSDPVPMPARPAPRPAAPGGATGE